ncbi:MAG: hypothetical protein WBJ87_08425 [Candidatus Hydrothermia bacterium]|nr:hypothetical protein [bacterium]
MMDEIEDGNYRGNGRQKKARGGEGYLLFGENYTGRSDKIMNNISEERRRSKRVSTRSYKD